MICEDTDKLENILVPQPGVLLLLLLCCCCNVVYMVITAHFNWLKNDTKF